MDKKPSKQAGGHYTWPLKIAAKIVFSRLPISYGTWKKIGMFRHGYMDSANYALKVFRAHAERAFPEGLPQNFSYLECGPGDTAASALVAYAHGASRITLVDVGDYAEKDIGVYRSMARDLKAKSLNAPNLDNAKNFDDMLRACNATYVTNGLESLKALPAHSIDFICSQSVLEHVRKREFDETMRQFARLLTPNGRTCHSIDFKDHLAFSLNNLRFSEKVWESEFFASSGFYTNRLRPSEITASLAAAGFTALSLHTARWPALPTPREKMTAPFRAMSDDDLLIRHMHVALKPGPQAAQKAA